MIIEDPDAFKTWLTAVLKPICEADPSALAKYVIALVKKDKSPEVLRQSMVNQLEVFLQKETEPFVTQLFKTLETQDYINSVIPNANPPNPNVNMKLTEVVTTVTPPAKVVAKPLPIIPVSEIAANLTETLNGKGIIKDVKDLEKKDIKKEEEKPLRRRSRHRSLSRNRSRSRSWDRTRRSRSRDKSRERDRLDRDKRERVRSWRNKSPPRRYDRRRSVSPGGRPRSRSRSPRHNYSALPHRGRYRNRSPPLRSTSRSRSRSLERRDRKDIKDREAAQSGAGTPTQDSNHAVDMDLRLTQSVQSAVVQPPPTNRPPGVPPPSDGNRRCRDYDEKGFCMRGEMCPYDHGVDPVVLEDSTLSRVLYAPNGTGDNMLVPPPSIVIPGPNPIMHMRHNLPAEYNPQAPQMWQHRPPNFRGGHRGGGMNSGPPRVQPMGFNPQSGPPLPNIQQRELISVPVLDSGNQQDSYGGGYQQQNNGPPSQNSGNNYNNQEQQHQQPGGFKKKPFDYNRLGPRQKNPSNCSLELKKVPTGLNNITHLNNHFHRFGKIVNIQVSYDGDPEAAIVTFSSHAEANVAYRSTEAVLNNRFIKVFWHTGNADSNRQENVPPRTIKERLGGQSGPGGSMLHPTGNVAPNANKVLNLVQPKANQDIKGGADAVEDDPEKIKELEAKKEELKAQASLAIKKSQELLAAKEKMKKNQEQKRIEAVRLTHNLRRRKYELLEKQLAQQKLLIDKLEKCPPGAQRDLLMQTIKKSQESIEVIRKDISSCIKTAVGSGTPTSPSATSTAMIRKTKEEVQKEVLDAELDLISKQAEGVDVTDLQKKIHDMKAKIPTLSSSIAAPAMRGSWTRGRARFNPIGRHLLSKNNLLKDRMKLKSPGKITASQQTHAVDHRPTRILVSGYESDEQESVLTHFGQFGEIVEYVSDASTPSVVLNYKTRKEAEFAVVKGKHFQDRTLSVTWCNNAQLNTLSRSSSRTVLINESEEQLIDSALLDGDEDIGTVLPEEVLLQDDEEEEEENEDRSWRR